MSNIVNDYVCFDLETTGFGKTAEIIDIGAVKVRNGIIIDKFSELVKPINRISGVVTALTGISQKDVENARRISDVLPDFLKFIENDILLGHNIASFDIPIVRRNVAVEMKVAFEPQYIDTMYLSKAVSGVPDHKLQTMLDYYGITNARAHRAFEDCEATSKLFDALVADGIMPCVRHSYSYTNIEAAQPVPVKEDIAVTMGTEKLSSVAGLRIALTGNFECCSRVEVETALAQMGAKLTNSISSKTNYLIVGGLGSDRWKYNNGGGKIQQATQLGVKILPETAISGLLREEQNV
jgi:DNA polymerase III epsilon subunit family exonuclease